MQHPSAEITEKDKYKAVLKAEYDAFMKYLLDNKVFEACHDEIKTTGTLLFNKFSQIYCQAKLNEECKKEFLKGISNGNFRLKAGMILSSFNYRERYNNLYLIGFFLNYYCKLLPVYVDLSAEHCAFAYQYNVSSDSREIERNNLQLSQNIELDQLMKKFTTTPEYSKAQSKGTKIAQAVETTLKSIIKLYKDDMIVATDDDLILSQPSKFTVASHSSRTARQNQERPKTTHKRKASAHENNLDSEEDISHTQVIERSSRIAARIAAGTIRDYYLDEEKINNSSHPETVEEEEVWAFADSSPKDAITMIHEDSNSSHRIDSSEINGNSSGVRFPLFEQGLLEISKKKRRIVLDSEYSDSEEKEDSHSEEETQNNFNSSFESNSLNSSEANGNSPEATIPLAEQELIEVSKKRHKIVLGAEDSDSEERESFFSEEEETQSNMNITLPSIGQLFQFPSSLQASRLQNNTGQVHNYQKAFDPNDQYILERLKEGNLKYFKWCVKNAILSDPRAVFFEIKEKKLLLEQKLSSLIATTKKYKLECQITEDNPTNLDRHLVDNLIYNASTFFYKHSNAKNEISAQLEKYKKAIVLMGQVYPNFAETTFNNN